MFKRLIRSLGRTSEADVREPTYGEYLLTSLYEAVRASLPELSGEEAASHVIQTLVSLEIEDADTLDESSRERFGRAFLDLLIDNEKLPPALQVSREDFRHPRDLLAGFFLGTVDVQAEAQTVLRFIERKFEDGRFAEAEVLLKIFDTDAANRRSNERNLFYEQMILRFTSERVRLMSNARREEWKQVSADALASSEQGVLDMAKWLSHEASIRLHLHARNPIEFDHWQDLMRHLGRAERLAITSLVPPARWREVGEHATDSVLSATMRHINGTTFESHIDGLIKSAYFVVLATGRTGHEELILRVLNWLQNRFEGEVFRVMPDLHRLSTVDGRGITEALEWVRSEYLIDTQTGSGHFSPEAVEEALGAVQRELAQMGLDRVPYGDYDLGGLVYDHLIGFDHGPIESALRMYRLT